MNDDRKIVVPSGDPQPAEILKFKLEQFLQTLQVGHIPSEEAISELQQLFSDYISSCKLSKEQLTDEQPSVSVEDQQTALWKDILPESERPVKFNSSFLNDSGSIKILKSLVLQKIITETQLSESDSFGNYLRDIGYITAVKLNDSSYWILTSRGWNWLNEKSTRQSLAVKDESFILSDKLVPDITTWSDSSFYQMDMIRKFYDADGITQFMIFNDQGCPNRLLGCEIRDSYAVSYCVAIDSESNIDVSDAVRIYDLGKSDRIDELTVIVRSQDEENRLKIKRGLDERSLGKLRFYILTEGKTDER